MNTAEIIKVTVLVVVVMMAQPALTMLIQVMMTASTLMKPMHSLDKAKTEMNSLMVMMKNLVSMTLPAEKKMMNAVMTKRAARNSIWQPMNG